MILARIGSAFLRSELHNTCIGSTSVRESPSRFELAVPYLHHSAQLGLLRDRHYPGTRRRRRLHHPQFQGKIAVGSTRHPLQRVAQLRMSDRVAYRERALERVSILLYVFP